MQYSITIRLFALLLIGGIYACQSAGESENSNDEKTEQSGPQINADTRIVSLNGTFTELLSALGFEENIVGVDVTSTYPESIASVQKLGHVTGIKAEGLAALNPDMVFVRKEELKPDLKNQIEELGIELIALEQEFTAEGTQNLIREVSSILGKSEKGESLIKEMNAELSKVEPLENAPTVLFIYARGPGTLLVAGRKTPLQSIIHLAGGKNISAYFEDFKPLTSEALVGSNPDAILLFSSGKESLEQSIGLLAVPGVAETNAGKNKNFINMNGLLLSGFGPRLGQATYELNQKLKAISNN
ncbi:MAG: ABC transporter substrate-binding protein [Chitinophagales bacterium]